MRAISRWVEAREASGIGGRLAILVNNYYITLAVSCPMGRKSGLLGRFSWNFTCSYFGAGVVVPPEFFLDFLPPLWAFFPDLVEVVFLPPSAGLSVDPPVAWANDRVAPSSRVNAMVSSFFIQSPSEKISFWESFNWGIIDVQHSKQRRWKKESGHLQGRFLETF